MTLATPPPAEELAAVRGMPTQPRCAEQDHANHVQSINQSTNQSIHPSIHQSLRYVAAPRTYAHARAQPEWDEGGGVASGHLFLV